MKLITSKGNEYDVLFVDGPTIISSHVMLKLQDDRLLSTIAAEFEGCETMSRYSEDQGNKTFEGYTAVMSIARQADGAVLIALGKGVNTNG